MVECLEPGGLWNLSDAPSFLLHATVTHGVGSSSIGLDRGETGASLLCTAEVTGAESVLVIAENSQFGAGRTSSPGEIAVTKSFARSALARCPVQRPGGTALMDPSALALVDLVGAQQRIADGTGTEVMFDAELSRVVETAWYGDILAVEAELTFVPSTMGVLPPEDQDHSPRNRSRKVLGDVVPHDSFTIRQQIALRPVPEPAEQRAFDPRVGAMPWYSTHCFDEIAQQDAYRRLTGRMNLDRGPITFYLDPAVPEPLRTAALQGGGWWQDVFAQAGLEGRFRFEELPASLDWRDPRISVVLWVHRKDRGWSYGMAHTDPRTGEILRGLVRIGSQRVEEIRSIAEAVLAPHDSKRPRTEMVDDLVASRIRQLVAHETGHALGLAHNFASHHHPIPSVMDYPAPMFDVQNGVPTVSAPYAPGPGPWDVAQIRMIYGSEDPSGVAGSGLNYLTDADARTHASAAASAATWVTTGEAAYGLEQVLAVREAALARFGTGVVPHGSDAHELERRFTLVYLLHRHQAAYMAKQVGGMHRCYEPVTTRFSGTARTVPSEQQRAALEALTLLITPEFLSIPAHIRALLVPTGGGHAARDGGFGHRTTGAFDVEEAVGAATDLVVSVLLAPERLNRVAQQYDDGGMGLGPVLSVTLDHAATLLNSDPDTTASAIAWTILDRLERTAQSPELHRGPRAALIDHCENLLESSETPASRRRWEGLIRTLAETSTRLPRAPLGVPI